MSSEKSPAANSNTAPQTIDWSTTLLGVALTFFGIVVSVGSVIFLAATRSNFGILGITLPIGLTLMGNGAYVLKSDPAVNVCLASDSGRVEVTGEQPSEPNSSSCFLDVFLPCEKEPLPTPDQLLERGEFSTNPKPPVSP